MEYESVIGLEVHAELLTKTKIFAPASAEFGGEPNSNVSGVCLGLPGVLPVLNKNVVNLAIRAGLALDFDIAKICKFDRKNYFYPDLPKGYQISQYDQPIGSNGVLEINVNGEKRTINIERFHMEEDAGKLVHAGADRLAGSTYSLADYNRAGVPLIEIVTKPEIRNSEEAKEYLQKLRNILIYTNVCDGKMEEGSLRCDANVSVRKKGTEKLGTRVEVKNLNSFKSLQRAIDYEIQRQIDAIESGDKIVQETRLWDENKGHTSSMRTKEDADDYRYFPDPDLVSLEISEEWVNEIKKSLPELPEQKKKRYQNELELSEYDADILVSSIEMASYFDQTVKLGSNPKKTANWIIGEISSYINENKLEFSELKLTPEYLNSLINLIEKGTISNKIGKKVFQSVIETGDHPEKIVEKSGATQISDEGSILPIIDNIISKNEKQVQEFLSGKDKIIGFFVGQVMKETKGRANPGLVRKLLIEQLNKQK